MHRHSQQQEWQIVWLEIVVCFRQTHWSGTSALQYRRLNHICENANVGVHLTDRFLPSHQVGSRRGPTRHFPHHFVPKSITLPLQRWPPLN